MPGNLLIQEAPSIECGKDWDKKAAEREECSAILLEQMSI